MTNSLAIVPGLTFQFRWSKKWNTEKTMINNRKISYLDFLIIHEKNIALANNNQPATRSNALIIEWINPIILLIAIFLFDLLLLIAKKIRIN